MGQRGKAEAAKPFRTEGADGTGGRSVTDTWEEQDPLFLIKATDWHQMCALCKISSHELKINSVSQCGESNILVLLPLQT